MSTGSTRSFPGKISPEPIGHGRNGYERDNVLWYSRSSKETGIEKGEYARVKHTDADKNMLPVVRADGSERTYDPHRQQGVSVYRDQEKAFSVGDRLQFTAPRSRTN